MSMPNSRSSIPRLPRRPTHLLHSEIDETSELIVFNPNTGQATVLSPVAGAIWLCCDGSHDENAICALLQEAFPSVSPGELRNDLRRVLVDFIDGDLIEP